MLIVHCVGFGYVRCTVFIVGIGRRIGETGPLPPARVSNDNVVYLYEAQANTYSAVIYLSALCFVFSCVLFCLVCWCSCGLVRPIDI